MIARGNYIAMDRPDTSFGTQQACVAMSNPRNAMLFILFVWPSILRSMQGCGKIPTCRDLLMRFGYTRIQIGAKDVLSRRSVSGGCIMIGRHLIRHWSERQSVIALSSVEAEL